MLQDEIEDAQRQVRTDAYQMSIGEIVNMYDEGDIIIAPEFQRLFRWEIGQKSKLIESLLLGIPLPPIFVYELESGKWELIDGLQRLSTILEFMGKLRDEDNNLLKPSVLEATKYLPSLHNAVWAKSDAIDHVPQHDQLELEKSLQLAIRRSRIGLEILKRPSDSKTKFDLFQRLNSGGTQANSQELRNCVMLMVNGEYFRAVKTAAERANFLEVISSTESQKEKQRHIEWAVRFLVHTLTPYDGRLDVGEYIDEGIVDLATTGNIAQVSHLINTTFDLLKRISGANALRRYADGQYSGRVGLVGLEGIAIGVARNLDAIQALPDSEGFVSQKAQDFWAQEEVENFVTPGLRGTVRIQRTVPYGDMWFRP